MKPTPEQQRVMDEMADEMRVGAEEAVLADAIAGAVLGGPRGLVDLAPTVALSVRWSLERAGQPDSTVRAWPALRETEDGGWDPYIECAVTTRLVEPLRYVELVARLA